MTDDQLERVVDDVRYIRDRMDKIGDDFGEYRVKIETRVTRLETKASVLGFLGGALASIGFRIGFGR